MQSIKKICGLDPGNLICGVGFLDHHGIGDCFNESSDRVFGRIMEIVGSSVSVNVVIEDIRPYFGARMSMQVIDTCKVIGMLQYRFGLEKRVNLTLVPRGDIKKWVFDTFPDVVIPRIEKKMTSNHARRLKRGEKGLMNLDGTMRQPSFHYVDDRIVIAAIKSYLDIPTPKPGKPNIYGLRDHSWQALACAAWFAHCG